MSLLCNGLAGMNTVFMYTNETGEINLNGVCYCDILWVYMYVKDELSNEQ